MSPAYTSKLGLRIYHTNVGAKKIDGSTFETFRMVLANFQVENKLRRTCFFQETSLLADIRVQVVLKMPFLTFGNANIKFAKKELTWRSYITAKALPITKRIEFIDKKMFAKYQIYKHQMKLEVRSKVF